MLARYSEPSAIMPLLFHGFLAIPRHREGIETFHTFNDSPSLRKSRYVLAKSVETGFSARFDRLKAAATNIVSAR